MKEIEKSNLRISMQFLTDWTGILLLLTCKKKKKSTKKIFCVGKDLECSLKKVNSKVSSEPCWQNNSTLMFVKVTHR